MVLSMQTKVLSVNEANAINHAADVLTHGGLVAFPTDTVYGLGALAFKEDGIMRMYFIKGRNRTKAIAILISSIEDLQRVAVDPSETAIQLADRFWPGPLTMVLPRHPDLPDVLSPSATLGVRIPDHPVALELLAHAGPLAVTSANLAEGGNAIKAQQVLTQLDGRVHLILDGGVAPGGIPSTVIDCTTDKIEILRTGPLKEKEIFSALA